jgi:LacI family transcriptional regulator
MSARATYRDIAERSGVSTATVSHVLRGTRPVSPSVRDAVLRVAADLEYVPNRLAAGLRRQASRTVGFVTADLTNPVYAEMAVGAEAFLHDRGYLLTLANTLNDEARETEQIHALAESRSDGLLLSSVRRDSTLHERLDRLGLPYVLLNRRIERARAPYVGVDNHGGMRAVVEHLIAHGHRRVGFIGGFHHSSAAHERHAGYREALRDAGLDTSEELYVEAHFDLEGGHAGAARLMALPPARRPTAIACANDMTAFGAMGWAMEHGLSVPADLSVTGFDDTAVAGLPFVGLTTAAQPLRAMGRRAAEVLVGLLDGAEADPGPVTLGCELVVRRSSGPAPSRAPRPKRARGRGTRGNQEEETHARVPTQGVGRPPDAP